MTLAPDFTPEEHFADLVASVAAVLGRSFQGVPFAEVLGAVQARLADLEPLAAVEVEFDANSLERGILQGLLTQMASLGSAPVASLAVH